MVEIEIPGNQKIYIKHAIFDFNGTLAVDGLLYKNIKNQIKQLSDMIDIYILSSDTYGTVEEQCNDLNAKVIVVNSDNGGIEKKEFVQKLGCNECVCIGNGLNDVDMFKVAKLSIIVIGEEGCASKALYDADIIVQNIKDALDLLLNTKRIIATLRK